MTRKHKLLLFVIILLAVFLRFYQIDKVPPGLYIDEASIGYNAASILHTGKDEYGERYPLFFRSFGDYKPPIYIYMTAGSMALFGINEYAVRFPSAIFGVGTIIVLYFFVFELFSKDKVSKSDIPPQSIALLSAFLLTVSPWHIHFSRGGFEVTVALFFYLLGCLLTLIFWRRKLFRFLLIASLCFIVSVYTYHTYKLVSPITWLIFNTIYFIKLPKWRKKLSLYAAIFIVLFIPMLLFSFTPNGSERFTSTSAFTEYPVHTVAEKLTVYPMVFLKDYFAFFSFDFLFGHGDSNGRHQLPGMGLFFKWQIPFLLLGLFWILRQKLTRNTLMIFGLLLLAPLIPSIARPSPNTLRALLMVIPLTILIACGLIYSFGFINKLRKTYISLLFLLATYSFVIYLHGYYAHYPVVNALDWGAANKEMIQKIDIYKKHYNYVVIDRNLAFAKSYVDFYEPSLKPLYKPFDLQELKRLRGSILLVTPYYGNQKDSNLIDQAYLPGPNKTVYAQFWKL